MSSFFNVKNIQEGKKREYKAFWHLSGQKQTNKNKNKESTDMLIIEIEASQSAKPVAI